MTTNPTSETSVSPVDRSVKEQAAVLGGVLWLCGFSALHQRYSVGMLLTRVVPAVERDQFRYFEDGNGTPVAFCNWALLSDEMLAAAKTGDYAFEPEDWRSGPHFFIPELIAPFGHCRQVIRDLRQNIVPPNERVWSTRGLIQKGAGNKDDAREPRVQRFRNVSFAKEE